MVYLDKQKQNVFHIFRWRQPLPPDRGLCVDPEDLYDDAISKPWDQHWDGLQPCTFCNKSADRTCFRDFPTTLPTTNATVFITVTIINPWKPPIDRLSEQTVLHLQQTVQWWQHDSRTSLCMFLILMVCQFVMMAGLENTVWIAWGTMTTIMMMIMMVMMMMTKVVVDLNDKIRELKYKSKMVSFLRQTWWPIYDKNYHLCDRSSKLRQSWNHYKNSNVWQKWEIRQKWS